VVDAGTKDALSGCVIRAAIEVHRALGPVLREAVDLQCLCIELEEAGLPVRTQVPVPVIHRGRTVPLGFRIGLLFADAIIVVVRAVASLNPVHEAQLLMNFHAPRLKDGLKRLVV